MARTDKTEMDERLAHALRDWDPRKARRLKEFDQRQGNGDTRWNARRRGERDRATVDPLPKTKDRRTSSQLTSVARGAERLLSPVEHFMYIGGALVYVGGTSSTTRIGPGRAAITFDGTIGEDERRAELVWAAAILYFDFLAVYRALRAVAPSRMAVAQLIAAWPIVDQRPVLARLLAAGASGSTIVKSLRKLPVVFPPATLLPVLSLVSYVGNGAHLMGANLVTLDLDDLDRVPLQNRAGRVRDLPEGVRRRLLDRRAQQIHVRRIPALPPERGVRTDEFTGTALADIVFAGHSLSRRFSHVAGAPRRMIDVASDAQLTMLYREGPTKAALAATAAMLSRSPGVILRLVRQAKVLGLVVPENTKQAV